MPGLSAGRLILKLGQLFEAGNLYTTEQFNAHYFQDYSLQLFVWSDRA